MSSDSNLAVKNFNKFPTSKPEHQHIMLDIETLGVDPGSVITSIAAIHFNIETGEHYKTFYERINIQSSLDAGLNVMGETLIFWFNQNDKAREEVSNSDNKSLSRTLQLLTEWFKSIDPSGKNILLYGNSSDFDCSILAAAYKTVKQNIPWKYFGTRCVRTIANLIPDIKKNEPFEGTQHNPIDDCKHQIKYTVKILNKIKYSLKLQ